MTDPTTNQKTEPTFRLRFFFDWRVGTCLWAANDAAKARFDYAVDPERLLSPETLDEIARIASWHDTSLNWTYPPDPGPWRVEECVRFNQAVRALLVAIQSELGSELELVDEFVEQHEDPDLDAYLADPTRYTRNS
jgi:hypothetical protein